MLKVRLVPLREASALDPELNSERASHASLAAVHLDRSEKLLDQRLYEKQVGCDNPFEVDVSPSVLNISTFMIHLLCFTGCSNHSSYRWTCHPLFRRRCPTKLTMRGAVIGPDCHRMPLKVQGLRLDEMTGDGEGQCHASGVRLLPTRQGRLERQHSGRRHCHILAPVPCPSSTADALDDHRP